MSRTALWGCVAVVVLLLGVAAVRVTQRSREAAAPGTEDNDVKDTSTPAEDQKETPSLGQKYRTAISLYEQGDYAGAQKLLVEIKETAKRDRLEINPETAKEIDRRLAEVEEKLRSQPSGQ